MAVLQRQGSERGRTGGNAEAQGGGKSKRRTSLNLTACCFTVSIAEDKAGVASCECAS
jgi:hypothetical protein